MKKIFVFILIFSASCSLVLDIKENPPSQCGNYIAEKGEICDGTDLKEETCENIGYYGGTLSCNSCELDLSSCEASGMCGDSIVNDNEACDGSNLNNKTCENSGYDDGLLGCNDSCQFDFSNCNGTVFCGDGTINGTEVCDGSNFLTSSDNCDDFGFISKPIPPEACINSCSVVDLASHCSASCGNVLETGEECDDGNSENGDGCNQFCQFETGFSCNDTSPGNITSCSCNDDNTCDYAIGLQCHEQCVEPVENTCSITDSIVLTSGSYWVNTYNLTDDFDEYQAGNELHGIDVFYNVSLKEDEYIVINGLATDFDFSIAILDSCAGPESDFSNFNGIGEKENLHFVAPVSGTYIIVLDTENGSGYLSFDISIGQAPSPQIDSNIFITEVYGKNGGMNREYIEFYNGDATPYNLHGCEMWIEAPFGNDDMITIDDDIIILPGAYLAIGKSRYSATSTWDTITWSWQDFYSEFITWNSRSMELRKNEDGPVIDYVEELDNVEYSYLPQGTAFSKDGNDDSNNWINNNPAPTPGEPNPS
jgi:cysteine-rich repeat protein